MSRAEEFALVSGDILTRNFWLWCRWLTSVILNCATERRTPIPSNPRRVGREEARKGKVRRGIREGREEHKGTSATWGVPRLRRRGKSPLYTSLSLLNACSFQKANIACLLPPLLTSASSPVPPLPTTLSTLFKNQMKTKQHVGDTEDDAARALMA